MNGLILDIAPQPVPQPVSEPAPRPPVKDLLEPDESVINPFYMRQLLEYGIRLGRSQSDMDPESLLREAEVCLSLVPGGNCVYRSL